MAPDLPIHEILAKLRDALNERDEVILEAPPGAGKTTAVPIALLNEPWLSTTKIVMLQPRRVAARTAAERMAENLGEDIGQTVGYRIRNESNVGNNTRIEVITEGVLTRQLQHDPGLEGIGLLIFDEFHERNVDSDLSLALALQGRTLFREKSLKILLMSATLGSDTFTSTLRKYVNNAPLLRSEGRSYPVEIIHHKNKRGDARTTLENTQHWLYTRITHTVTTAFSAHTGNILIFLPGKKEIATCLQQLKALHLPDTQILPLHGSLSIQEQRRVIHPPTKTIESKIHRRIIVATDIAETSLTIAGITVVIDSGLARVSTFDANTATSRLSTQRISKASSTQRAGRAGRLAPGVCYRLWTDTEHKALVDQRAPEILQVDLAALALQLFQWGASSADELAWLDPPPSGHFQQALALLQNFDAVEKKHGILHITPHGQRMAMLPLHPRLSNMLIISAEIGALKQGANIAAALSERDVLGHLGSDFSLRLDALDNPNACPPSLSSWRHTVKLQSQKFHHLARGITVKTNNDLDHNQTYAYLAALAYPDRIAMQSNTQGVYKLSNGRTSKLKPDDSLSTQSFLVVLDLGGNARSKHDRIFSALILDEQLLETQLSHLLSEASESFWDAQSGRFIAHKHISIGRIKWQTLAVKKPNHAQRKSALLAFIQQGDLEHLAWDTPSRNFQARLALAAKFDTQQSWPDLNDHQLKNNITQWLSPYLDGVENLEQLKKIDVLSALKSQLTWPQLSRLDHILPLTITVPSGSKISIDYLQQPPVLAVKLQEMFGAKSSPSVLEGTLPLCIHLLSPARRPLQITQDIAAFWHNAYQEVKKEMRGRYPKHPWPDDPQNSAPTAHTKHRRTKT